MAAPGTTAARVTSLTEMLMDKLRNVKQIRDDVTDMGGATYVASVLDGGPDPVPDLSSVQLMDAMQAIAAVTNGLAANGAVQRIALLTGFLTPSDCVGKVRSSIREFRDALADLTALGVDITDAGGQAWLESEGMSTVDAAKVVAALAAVDAIHVTLDAGAGTRRKDLRRASD